VKKTSPYHLVYGQEAVLPWEITAGSRRVEFLNDLIAEEYATLMNDNVEDLTELRLWSLEKIKERSTRRATVKMFKIQWNHHTEEEATWETEDYLQKNFPDFLKNF
jgi:hypothetical protein